MNKFIVAAALVILGTAGQADSVLPKAHVLALACLENLGATSTWNQCLGNYSLHVWEMMLERKVMSDVCKGNEKIGA